MTPAQARAAREAYLKSTERRRARRTEALALGIGFLGMAFALFGLYELFRIVIR